MKILITGTNGFIGRNIVTKLKDKYQFISLYRQGSSIREPSSGVESVIYDGSFADLTDKLQDKQIEGVIHLASYFVKDHKSDELDAIVDSNIGFGMRLLELAKQQNVKWFLNTSTFWTHYENEDYRPVNLYAASKKALIDLAKFYSDTSDLKFATLELSDTFGPGDERGKIVNLLLSMAENKRELKVSPGEQELDISYIDDVVSGFDRMITLLKQNQLTSMDAYSLYSTNKMSLKQLIEKFESVLGRKLDIELGATDYRPREVMKTWDRGKAIPGFTPNYSFEKGIEICLRKKGII